MDTKKERKHHKVKIRDSYTCRNSMRYRCTNPIAIILLKTNKPKKITSKVLTYQKHSTTPKTDNLPPFQNIANYT